jgi:hypothetical protein
MKWNEMIWNEMKLNEMKWKWMNEWNDFGWDLDERGKAILDCCLLIYLYYYTNTEINLTF